MSVELHVNERRGSLVPGGSLFEAAQALGVRVPTSCQKQGRCKECLVEITEGSALLSPRTKAEAHLRDSFRLSCQCELNAAAASGVVRCHTMRRGQMRIEKHALALPVDHRTWKLEPAVRRDGARVLLEGEEIARGNGPLHGLAMDLGTTTVVLRLLNLETGEIVADSSFENPQRFGGSDVMARIQYDTEDGTGLLQRTLAGYLSHAIQEFPVDPSTIYELVVAGNSTMRDLFFGLDVEPIGQSPYQSVTERELAAGGRNSTSLSATAKRLRLPLHPRARVYGLPIISGHVGADAAACMLAVDLANEERLVAVMDIGTNTELILGNKHKILAASCPAGPAFEGGKIACGMPGLPGAIERVKLNGDGKVELHVIGDGAPEGICGSGLVDLLSELLNGKMNALGRFVSDEERMVLARSEEGEVYFTEADINELAQAKGANAAGLQIIFEHYGAQFEDLEMFYLAGGFGRNLEVGASKRIGLIPNLPDAKIRQVGNASVEGACIALLSLPKRRELEEMVRQVVHCRLETHPQFFDYFVEGCQFRPLEKESAGCGG